MYRNRDKQAATSRVRYRSDNVDKYVLYQESVQDAEAEIEFITTHFKRLRKRVPLSLREDFCGTALVSTQWVNSHPQRHATGIDLDPSVLEWARRNNLPPLGRAVNRVTLLRQNVMQITDAKFDAIAAMNFSYFVFKKRAELLAYFRAAKASLKDDGMFFLDCYGGSDAYVPQEEKRKLAGFTYVWDQAEYNPIDSHVINHIHYRFPDGSELKRAFTYDWRLWTLAEITEALEEVSFSNVTVYWEGDDKKTGEGNGVFLPTKREDNCLGWVAYISACA